MSLDSGVQMRIAQDRARRVRTITATLIKLSKSAEVHTPWQSKVQLSYALTVALPFKSAEVHIPWHSKVHLPHALPVALPFNSAEVQHHTRSKRDLSHAGHLLQHCYV